MSQLEHHAVSICIDASAEQVFAYMADPARLGEWAFENAYVDASGLASGTSRFDGHKVYARAQGDPKRLIIDYHVGDSPDALAARIMAKVVPGSLLALSHQACGLTLMAWRALDMAPLRWRQLVAAHEMEILLLKNQIEALD